MSCSPFSDSDCFKIYVFFLFLSVLPWINREIFLFVGWNSRKKGVFCLISTGYALTFLNFFPSFSVCVPCVFAAKFVIFTVFECVDLDPTAGTGRVDGSDGRCGCLQVVSCGTVQMEINNFGSVSVKQSMLTCTGEAIHTISNTPLYRLFSGWVFFKIRIINCGDGL